MKTNQVMNWKPTSVRKWKIWSIKDDTGMAMVVGEGSKSYCEEAAGRRNAAATRLGTGSRFEALPNGEQPEVFF